MGTLLPKLILGHFLVLWWVCENSPCEWITSLNRHVWYGQVSEKNPKLQRSWRSTEWLQQWWKSRYANLSSFFFYSNTIDIHANKLLLIFSGWSEEMPIFLFVKSSHLFWFSKFSRSSKSQKVENLAYRAYPNALWIL